MSADWLQIARRLQTIVQAGLTYSRDPYDQDRYKALQEIVAQVVAEAIGAPQPTVQSALSLETGYATPKVDVRAAVFERDRILLVRERQEKLWAVPGGWADLGESPGECAVREVHEESGLEVRPARVLAVWDRDRHGHPPLLWHVYKICILCEMVSGSRRGSEPSLETDDAGFFSFDELPALSTSRITSAEIARFFEHYHDPRLPTDFD